MAYAWTEERVAKLRELHAKKLSASQIAAELPRARGEEPPTRNAVIGKLTRLKLFYEGPKKQRYRPRVSTPAVKIEAEKTLTKWREANPKIAAVWAGFDGMLTDVPRGSEAILGLRNGLCCFPIGDPHADDFRYCCAPSGVKTYCAHHMAVAYIPTKPRKPARKSIDMRPQRRRANESGAVFDRAEVLSRKRLFDPLIGSSNRDRGRVYDGV